MPPSSLIRYPRTRAIIAAGKQYAKQNPGLQSGTEFVYFIRCNDAVKIGITTNVYHRLNTIQSANPIEIELLGVILGDRQMERELHAKFIRSHRRGEWFYLTKDILQYINQNTSPTSRQASVRGNQ